MDPYFELLESGGTREEDPQGTPYLHIARFLHQMGVLDDFDSSKLAPAASKEVVKQLPKVTLTDETDVKCPICLIELGTGDVQVTMPCKHAFHDQCILAWLSKTNSCPVCRFELKTDDPKYEEFRENKRREVHREENVRNLHHSMYS